MIQLFSQRLMGHKDAVSVSLALPGAQRKKMSALLLEKYELSILLIYVFTVHYNAPAKKLGNQRNPFQFIPITRFL